MAKLKIMLVEDEAIIAKDLENTLKKFGYEICALVDTGEGAVKKAAETKPDIVLMSIQLKDKMNGMDAAEEIYKRFNIPIIYITGYLNKEVLDRVKQISNYFQYFLRKPINTDDLPVTIEGAYHRYSEN